MNGHAGSLSFAAFGRRLKVGGWVNKAACGAGAMAALTASSNWSNSISVFARSNLACSGIFTLGIVTFPKSAMRHCGIGLSPFDRREWTGKRTVCVKIVRAGYSAIDCDRTRKKRRQLPHVAGSTRAYASRKLCEFVRGKCLGGGADAAGGFVDMLRINRSNEERLTEGASCRRSLWVSWLR